MLTITDHTNEVNAWMERVRQEKRAEQEKRATAETEWRERAKEGVNLRWMRTVPKSAKKHVSKVSAEDSVAAVAVVRARGMRM